MVSSEVWIFGERFPVGRIARLKESCRIKCIGVWIDGGISGERPGQVSIHSVSGSRNIPFDRVDVGTFWNEVAIVYIILLEFMRYSYSVSRSV